MIVLEHPEQGTGVYKRLLDKIVRSAGIPPEDVWVTYLFHCQPPTGVKPSKADRDQCKVWLWRELKMVQPRAIVSMGMGPTSLLQRSKPRLADVVGVGSPLTYFPWGVPTLIPYYSLSKVYRGPRGDIYDLVDLLKGLS